jgi:oxygen-independent coproporphyrinogen-3 oxidase
LARLLAPVTEAARRDRIREFTVEANPGTISEPVLGALTGAGVDRISMGAQSFHPAELKTLERLHAPEDIPPAVELCRRSGIRRLNLDLIFGIPGQTMESWMESLRRAIELGVDHVSCYGLTYEPGTALTARRNAGGITPCDEELEAEMYLAAIDALADAGFEQYELSNFARPGQRCLHNLVYWRNESYIGVGPSAAGYLDGERYKNVSSIDGYVRSVERDGNAVVERERVEGAALGGETAMLQLRLNEGIRFAAFERRTGFDARDLFAGSIERYAAEGLIHLTEESVALSRTGRLIADTVIADFMAEAGQGPGRSLKVLEPGVVVHR